MMIGNSTDAAPAMEGNAYRTLLDAVGAFVYATDLRGNFTFANKLVLELLRPGLQLEDVIGKAFTDFVAIDEDAGLRETDRRVLEHGETIEREEANYIHATGETRHYWSTKKPLRDGSGTIVGMIGISHDITEKKRLEDQLLRQKNLLNAVLENVDALVYLKGADHRFQYVNPRVADAFGIAADSIVGRLDSDFLAPEVGARFQALDTAILESGKRHTSEEVMLDADGRVRHYWSVVVPGVDADGTPALIGVSTDITELHELREELRRQTRTDSLTNVANRRSFFERATSDFAHARADGGAMSLIAIDIDHFKQINDHYGHPVGDKVLQDFAECCAGALRPDDLLARTGGEEFCVLLPGVGIEDAHATAERLRAMTAACPCGEFPELRVHISLGVSSMAPGDPDFDALFRRADRALYQAKERGRNCTVTLPGP